METAVEEMVSKGIFWHEALTEFEKLFILKALDETGGSVIRAAQKMGIHRNTLSKKLRDHGLRNRRNR